MSARTNNPMQVEVRPPRAFGLKEVVIVNALSAVPSLACGLLFGAGVTGLVGAAWLALFCRTPLWWMLIPLVSLALCSCLLYFAPFLFFANYYIRSIAAKLDHATSESDCVCQIATYPRSCRGIGAFLEDADDIGVLWVGDDGIDFKGDHLYLTVPHSSVASVHLSNVGWRGLWFIGQRIRLELYESEEFHALELCERQSSTVAEARSVSLRLFKAIGSSMKRT